jgi:predicted transcriptional regulator
MSRIKPTPSELEILKILWQHGPSSVRDVHSLLSKDKDVFYTTTLKTMQVMLAKDLLSRDTSNRSHIYASAVQQKEIEKSLIDSLVNSVFSGSTTQLIMSALGNKRVKPGELEQIQSLLENLEDDE